MRPTALLRRAAARHGEPLVVDTDVITSDEADLVPASDGRRLIRVTDVFGQTRVVEALPLPR